MPPQNHLPMGEHARGERGILDGGVTRGWGWRAYVLCYVAAIPAGLYWLYVLFTSPRLRPRGLPALFLQFGPFAAAEVLTFVTARLYYLNFISGSRARDSAYQLQAHALDPRAGDSADHPQADAPQLPTVALDLPTVTVLVTWRLKVRVRACCTPESRWQRRSNTPRAHASPKL
jgi:hypothetical protein